MSEPNTLREQAQGIQGALLSGEYSPDSLTYAALLARLEELHMEMDR